LISSTKDIDLGYRKMFCSALSMCKTLLPGVVVLCNQESQALLLLIPLPQSFLLFNFCFAIHP